MDSLDKQFLANKHLVFVLAQTLFSITAVAFAVLGFLCGWFPAPGVSVAIIAVVAATVSIHGDMEGSHKALWMLIIGAFLVLELVSIRHERNVQTAAQKTLLDEERKHFGEIGDGIKATISDSDSNFNATMGQFSSVISQTGSVLLNVTGGDSYGVVVPQTMGGGDQIPLLVWNKGNNPLTGVTVSIARTNDPVPVWSKKFYEPITIGTVSPHWYAPVPSTVITPKIDPTTGMDHYWIMISAQNGTVSEGLWLRPDKRSSGLWAASYMVTKDITKRQVMDGVVTNVSTSKLLERGSWSDEPSLRPHQK